MNSGLQNLRVCNLQGGQFSDSNTRTLLEESTSSNNRYYR